MNNEQVTAVKTKHGKKRGSIGAAFAAMFSAITSGAEAIESAANTVNALAGAAEVRAEAFKEETRLEVNASHAERVAEIALEAKQRAAVIAELEAQANPQATTATKQS